MPTISAFELQLKLLALDPCRTGKSEKPAMVANPKMLASVSNKAMALMTFLRLSSCKMYIKLVPLVTITAEPKDTKSATVKLEKWKSMYSISPN